MTFKRKPNEYYFVLYLFIFPLLRPVLAVFPNYTTSILFICVLYIISRRLWASPKLNKNSIIKWLIVTIIFIPFFIWSIFFEHYDIVNQYFINYIIYAVIPLFLMIDVNNYDLVISYISKFSILTTILLIADPFFKYFLTGGYMEYGLNLLMYSLTGMILNYYYFNRKKYFILIIIDLIFIAIYGNKGALIGAIVLFIISEIFKNKLTIKKIIIYIAMIISVAFWKNIVLTLVAIAKLYVKDSYSLNTMQILVSESIKITSVRTKIWESAIDWVKRNPLGYGIGKFETLMNGYTHNIELDIVITFGIIGLIIFFFLCLYATKKIIYMKDRGEKIFLIGCLICWFVPMQFSLTFWNVSLFWTFWGGILYQSNTRT